MYRNLRLIYITTENRDEARKIGSVLVDERLAACVNILDGMESLYHWEGGVESGQETILIAKTTQGNVHRLTERVKSLHSYDCPCVVSFTVTEQEGNEQYLDWLIGEVAPHRNRTFDPEEEM